MFKKGFVLLFCVFIAVVALSGCGSKVPEAIKNPHTQFQQIKVRWRRRKPSCRDYIATCLLRNVGMVILRSNITRIVKQQPRKSG